MTVIQDGEKDAVGVTTCEMAGSYRVVGLIRLGAAQTQGTEMACFIVRFKSVIQARGAARIESPTVLA